MRFLDILEIIGLFFLAMLVVGAIAVKYALSNNMHVPTNKEIITSVKAAQAAKTAPKKENRIVKASDIKRLNQKG